MLIFNVTQMRKIDMKNIIIIKMRTSEKIYIISTLPI